MKPCQAKAGAGRLLEATADPGTLPDKATRYLVTNLPRARRRREGAARRRTAGPVLAAGAARRARLLSPWIALRHWWPAWSTAPPPRQLQALINSVAAGCGLHPYIPN